MYAYICVLAVRLRVHSTAERAAEHVPDACAGSTQVKPQLLLPSADALCRCHSCLLCRHDEDLTE